MRTFTTVFEKDLYSCEVKEAEIGGLDVAIYKICQGRDPKKVFSHHVWDMLGAQLKMKAYLPDAKWTEKDPPAKGFAPVYYEDEKKYSGLLSEE